MSHELASLTSHLDIIGVVLFILFAYWRITITQGRQKQAVRILDDAIAHQKDEPLTLHPEVDPSLCAGCGACTRVCPEGDILKIISHKAVLVAPTKCVGHGECERACPFDAITLVFGTKKRGMDIPRLTTNYETNVPGLYIAGELGGMGLIRNALKQGALAAKHAASSLSKKDKGLLSSLGSIHDFVIVGAGPAGLAVGLVAIASQKSYYIIEQNTFGGTVANFPRQKIVMTHPAQIPIVGTMKFPKNRIQKEDLIEYWNSVRQKTGLKVHEQTHFQGVEIKDGVFAVTTSKGVIYGRKVFLCMGVRGTPRRLGLVNEDLPKVAYQLLDPAEYQKREIVVVGAGNAGVEAALALGKKSLGNRVKVLVRGDGFDRCNQENEDLIRSMAASNQVEILFQTTVTEIYGDRLVIKTSESIKTIANDYLFIFAGAELPTKFLMGLGVEIDKKFGKANA